MAYSVFRDLVEDTGEQRRTFFKLVFGDQIKGYVCVSYKDHVSGKMYSRFFSWPNDIEEMLENIEVNCQGLVNAYFCPNLYKSPGESHGRKFKEFVATCTNIWADLDTCSPQNLLVPPSIVTETSPGKYHALWLLEEALEPAKAELIAAKIAYAHADQGADRSGHDLTQLLRIPYTPNLKYGMGDDAPIVVVTHAERLLYRPSDFDVYPMVEGIRKYIEPTPPPTRKSKALADELVRAAHFGGNIQEYYHRGTTEEWSGALWAIINACRESGLSQEDAFVVANAAACNKYRRDGRPETDLWREVRKVYLQDIESKQLLTKTYSTIPELLSAEEAQLVLTRKTVIDRYIDWATEITDAPTQYHQAGAFVILSALLSGSIVLPTSFGNIRPNLWFMLLGTTTITRKTTAMNTAMELLYEIDEEALFATDSTVEGMLVGLRDRPRQSSIFKRDEFSGLLEAIAHRDYMAGFAEQLTQLYDGTTIKRLLRKEVIHLIDPIFIMFVSGIKEKTQSLITEELVMGGFIPRFIMITAKPDLDSLRDVGPPRELSNEVRDYIKNEFIDIRNHYNNNVHVKRNGAGIGHLQTDFNVVLTQEAWARYNKFERSLMKSALAEGTEYLFPLYDRLAKSTLKAAMLIAASAQRSMTVIVGIQDLIQAIYYAIRWRDYAVEIVNNVGKTSDEKLIDKIFQLVTTSGVDGVSRAEIMRKFSLDSKRSDLLLKTMEQRLLITMADGRYRANV